MCLLSGLRQVHADCLHADILAAPDSELYDSSLPLHGRLSSDGDDGIVLTLLRDPAAASFTADPTGPTLDPVGFEGGVGFRPGSYRIAVVLTERISIIHRPTFVLVIEV